jgi:hypothetical protein
MCSADSVQSVSPAPVQTGPGLPPPTAAPPGAQIGAGMVAFGRDYRKKHPQ